MPMRFDGMPRSHEDAQKQNMKSKRHLAASFLACFKNAPWFVKKQLINKERKVRNLGAAVR